MYVYICLNIYGSVYAQNREGILLQMVHEDGFSIFNSMLLGTSPHLWMLWSALTYMEVLSLHQS